MIIFIAGITGGAISKPGLGWGMCVLCNSGVNCKPLDQYYCIHLCHLYFGKFSMSSGLSLSLSPSPLSLCCALFLLPFYLQSLSLYIQVDVAGTMYFWGVTIDTASSILLTLCVGLAVDYSAHIGHTFMTVSGSKNGEIFLIGYRTSIAQTILSQTF